MTTTSSGAKIQVLSDNSGYYIFGNDASLNSQICKYLHSSSTSQCRGILYLKSVIGQIMTSDTQLFTFGYDSSTGYYGQYITFTNSINWSTKFSWSITGSCTTFSAESLLSADKTKIYTFFINGNLAYFASLLVSTGSVSGSAYKSSISWTSINGLMLQKDNVIATLSCTLSPSSYVLILFNTISNSFIIKASSSLSLYQLTEENAGGR